MSKLYLITSPEGICKIGKSVNPERRMQTLQAGCCLRLSLAMARFVSDPYDGEAQMHAAFAKNRIFCEWFLLSDDQIAQAMKMLAEMNPPVSRLERLLKTEDVCRRYGLEAVAVRQMVKQRAIPFYVVTGAAYRFKASELDKIFELKE